MNVDGIRCQPVLDMVKIGKEQPGGQLVPVERSLFRRL